MSPALGMKPARLMVETGSREISRTADLTLEAHLGTCVGVALWDQERGVGGLVHLLLPRPIASDYLDNPYRYATIGLPRLLGELLQEGAVRGRLRAALAGGAYLGDVADWETDLDIGGLTLEAVERILSEEKVAVDRFETGGLFTCRLCLDCRRWAAEIEPFRPPEQAGDQQAGPRPEKPDLSRLTADIDPIPQMALKIIRMISVGDYAMEKVAGEVRKDQVISAKVIQLCNSSYFRRAQSIDSIDRALVVVGDRNLLKMVVSAALENFFPVTMGAYSLTKGGLYQHSLGAAQFAEQLARHTGAVPPDVAYTAGLLHDIGKAALDQHLEGSAASLYHRTQEYGQPLLSVENDLIGTDHATVGAFLARRWNCPDRLVQSIEFHHMPERATDDGVLTHIVYFADLLMSRLVVGQEVERLNTHRFVQRLARIGLEPSGFQAAVDSLSLDLLGS